MARMLRSAQIFSLCCALAVLLSCTRKTAPGAGQFAVPQAWDLAQTDGGTFDLTPLALFETEHLASELSAFALRAQLQERLGAAHFSLWEAMGRRARQEASEAFLYLKAQGHVRGDGFALLSALEFAYVNDVIYYGDSPDKLVEMFVKDPRYATRASRIAAQVMRGGPASARGLYSHISQLQSLLHNANEP